MTRLSYAMLLAWTAVLVAGCTGEYKIAPGYDRGDSGQPGGEVAPPTSQPQSPSSPEPRSAPVPPAPIPPVPVQPMPGQPSASGQPSIRLSAGVALPQSLPTGTAMGFSVDYQFTQGRPSPSSPYFWVIEPSKGQPVRREVRLRDQDTLQGFAEQLRPENGPFKTHIEDANGNRLSPSIPLR